VTTAAAQRKQILFVDDDGSILSGLRLALRADRPRWEMRFASSGEEALEALEVCPADVVVSDMRMPGMDGVELLKRVREHWPRTARVVLSGYADLAAVARASSFAHQYLLKPCDAGVLRAVLERACALQDVLHSESLRRMVGSAGSLPAVPRVYQALTRALEDPLTEARHLVPIVQSDVSISTRVLQFVNSAYYGLAEKVTSIEAAILYLGLRTVRHLALSIELHQAFQLPPTALGELERHARLAAQIARKLVSASQADTAFAAGLLHDAGQLVLMSRMPQPYAEATRRAVAGRRPLHEAEREVLGASHAEVGAYLLGLWGLPPPIVEAVAFHHQERPCPGSLDTIDAVGVACLLAQAVEPARAIAADAEVARSRLELLAPSRVPGWIDMARAEAMQLSPL
jgi:HD-like signal output (HDOD) protein